MRQYEGTSIIMKTFTMTSHNYFHYLSSYSAPLIDLFHLILRRSITPSAFEDQHRYSPNSRFLQHQFELPLGNAVPDKEGLS